MVIVLEGVDGSGKSTLAHLLAQVLGAEIVHCTRETPNTYEWFMQLLKQGQEKHLILDRAFWGQFVYQPPSERKLTEEELHLLEAYLRLTGGKLIYVTANSDSIGRRLVARKEALSRPLDELISGYRDRIALSEAPVLEYNSNSGVLMSCEVKMERRPQ